MFTPPPYLASYTAPGWPLVWEPIRAMTDEFFLFANPGSAAQPTLRIRHWPDFSSRGEAEAMLRYARQIDPSAELVTRALPVPLTPAGNNPAEIGLWAIAGQLGNSQFLAATGFLADLQTGLRGSLQANYLNQAGMQWNDFGQIISGQNAWPWDTLYASRSPHFDHAELYWGNSSTGPIL